MLNGPLHIPCPEHRNIKYAWRIDSLTGWNGFVELRIEFGRVFSRMDWEYPTEKVKEKEMN